MRVPPPAGRSLFSGTPEVGGSGVTTGTGIPASPVSVSTGSTTGNGITTGIPLNTSLGAGVPTSGFGFSHRSPNFAVDFFITAAEAKGVGKLLSKPKVITQNNEKATVKQGTKIPIQTTINNTISVQFIDAVLKLEVTPQITAEGTVFMDVLVENTQIDTGIPRVQGIPALDTQSAETKVTGGRWRHGSNRRNHHLFAARGHHAGADSRQHPDHRQPVQAHQHFHPVAGTAVLPDAAHHTWIIGPITAQRRINFPEAEFIEETSVSSILFYEDHILHTGAARWSQKFGGLQAGRFAGHPSGGLVLPDGLSRAIPER